MRGVKTGDQACSNTECTNRVPTKRFCDTCRRVMNEMSRAAQAVLFPPRQEYAPRVVKVLRD